MNTKLDRTALQPRQTPPVSCSELHARQTPRIPCTELQPILSPRVPCREAMTKFSLVYVSVYYMH